MHETRASSSSLAATVAALALAEGYLEGCPEGHSSVQSN